MERQPVTNDHQGRQNKTYVDGWLVGWGEDEITRRRTMRIYKNRLVSRQYVVYVMYVVFLCMYLKIVRIHNDLCCI